MVLLSMEWNRHCSPECHAHRAERLEHSENPVGVEQKLPDDQSVGLDIPRLSGEQPDFRLLETQSNRRKDVGYDTDEARGF